MDGKADTISVIVPVYNVENYVGQCIESIINQSYTELQIILVDDGSTDQSGLICDEYANKDTRIQVIHKSNGGPVSARKAGIDAAIGKYTGFVDADDYVDSDMYQTLHFFAEGYQVEFVHSGYFEENATQARYTTKEVTCYGKDKEKVLNQLFSLHPSSSFGASMWVNLFRREFIAYNFNKVPDESVYGEDLMVMCYCIINANSFVCIPNAFYHYRMRRNSLSKNISEQRFLDYFNLYSALKKYLLEAGYLRGLEDILRKRFSILGLQALAEFNHYYIPKYKYPVISELKGKCVALYGAGRVGQDYYHQMREYQYCNVVCWIDKKEKQLAYAEVEGTEALSAYEYDVIVIAVLDKSIADEIKRQLRDLHCSCDRIVWKEPVFVLD